MTKKNWRNKILLTTTCFLCILFAGCNGTKNTPPSIENSVIPEVPEDTKVTQETQEPATFQAFLTAESAKPVKAHIDKDFYAENETLLEEGKYKIGDSLTFQELSDYITARYIENYGIFEKPLTIEYADIICGKDKVVNHAIRFRGGQSEQDGVFYLFSERDNQLYLTYACCSYYRTFSDINRYGYISNFGAGSAAMHSGSQGVLDAAGIYKEIDAYERWDSSAIQEIDETFKECYGKVYHEEYDINMGIEKHEIGEDVFFLKDFYGESKELEQKAENFAKECGAAGVQWTSKEELEKKLGEVKERTGLPIEVFQPDKEENEIRWEKLK